ncbi:RNA ligase [Inmirania thermothiophila]|uniref:Putative ATP-dependent DNA ligase n=1 Tax=Inmirania thermothiophila TaxID=1750597 RepID=A0A3N1Y6Z5_9GAMM|nr:RNA ligase [Inmirania thermothiophila]ROR34599.1 putative ATP-dependent DNA ligase [Inmirania thermothiophila]
MAGSGMAALREAAGAAGKLAAEEHEGLRYERLVDDWHGLARGTVFAAGIVIPGYPPIPRILRLATGLAERFPGPFRVEEKIDGYNVRYALVEGRLLGFSRGGFVCPFATDRGPELFDPAVLEEAPSRVLCAELAGPGNPYNIGRPPDPVADVALYAFDLLATDGSGFLPAGELDALAAAGAVRRARLLGRHTAADVAALRTLLHRLDAERREGVVFKEDGPQGRRAKYTTARVTVDDLRVTGAELLDLPPWYFTGRLLRLALFVDEEGLPRERLAAEMGTALLEGMLDAVAQVRDHGRVEHAFRCRFRARANAERFAAMLRGRAAVQVLVDGIEPDAEGYHVLRFRRVYPAMTGLLANVLRGGAIED